MMKQLTLLATVAALLVGAGLTVRAAPAGGGGGDRLDVVETLHLTFMREEEKLARDVYLTFAQKYPAQIVFQTIATDSEQTHTDTMYAKLVQYDVPDPNPATNELPASLGVFTGAEFGPYFTTKFNELVAKGSSSELAALYVGAFIEELDMNDIIVCPQVIRDTHPEITGACGLEYTDAQGLISSYTSLVQGSENHLRAYVGQIEAVIGVGNYQAQYLPQDVVDAILGR